MKLQQYSSTLHCFVCCYLRVIKELITYPQTYIYISLHLGKYSPLFTLKKEMHRHNHGEPTPKQKSHNEANHSKGEMDDRVVSSTTEPFPLRHRGHHCSVLSHHQVQHITHPSQKPQSHTDPVSHTTQQQSPIL